MFLVLIGALIFTVVTKFYYDAQSIWHNNERAKLTLKIKTLIELLANKSGKKELESFVNKYKRRRKKRKHELLIEEIFFALAENSEAEAVGVRAIAYALNYPPQCIDSLKKNSKSQILHGCMQARTYLYKPAIPYMLQILDKSQLNIQYDILLALTHFNDPKLIAKAFGIIQNAVMVNERTVRQIVNRISSEKQLVLFEKILALDSDYLSSLFLKCIDKESAIYLKDKIIPFYHKKNMKELRIAAIKAMATTQDSSVVPILIDALTDPSWEMRAVAASGLQDMNDERAIEPLLNAVSDPEWWVRQNTITTLVGYPNAEQNMKRVLETKDKYAIESLKYAAELTNKTDILNPLLEQMDLEEDSAQ